MNSNTIMGIISIILGLVIICCPLAGFVALSWVIALSVIFLGIYELIDGFTGDISWASVILGIIFIILGAILFFYPVLLQFIIAFVNYLVGILLIVLSIVNLFTAKGTDKYVSISGIIFGILAIIFAYLVSLNIIGLVFIAVLLGVWFIISGIMKIALPAEE